MRASPAGLEELQGGPRLRVLAEDDHTYFRMELPQAGCDLDALVGVRGRHSDVGHHHVRLDGLYSPEERRHVVARRDDLDAWVSGEELLDPLQDEKAVVRDGNPNRHSGNDKAER